MLTLGVIYYIISYTILFLFYPSYSLLSSPSVHSSNIPDNSTPHVLSEWNVEWCILMYVVFVFRADVWCILLYILLYLILYSPLLFSLLLFFPSSQPSPSPLPLPHPPLQIYLPHLLLLLFSSTILSFKVYVSVLTYGYLYSPIYLSQSFLLFLLLISLPFHPLFSSSPSLFSSSVLFFPSQYTLLFLSHSKYTCRHLDILIYIIPNFPNI